MGKFNRGDKFGGKKRFDGDRDSRRGDRSDRPSMHRAVCSDCGRDCEVPFRPTGDKPVFCSDCFGGKKGSGGNRFEKRSQDRSDFRSKQMFKATCDKCRKECEVPFRPSADKPVFCNDCFGKGDKSNAGNNVVASDQYKKQFEMLNNKLDNILNILSQKKLTEKTVFANFAKEVKKEDEKKQQVKKVVSPKKEVKKVVKKTATPKKVVKKTVKKVTAKKKK